MNQQTRPITVRPSGGNNKLLIDVYVMCFKGKGLMPYYGNML